MKTHDQMLAGGVGHADAVVGGIEGHLGAEDRREPEGPGGLGEAYDAVEAVVVGEGQAREAEAGPLSGQLLGPFEPTYLFPAV